MGVRTLNSIAKKGIFQHSLTACLNFDYLSAKAETYQCGVPGDHATHGTSGPLKISMAEDEANIGSQFLAVAAEYDKERGFTSDTNDFFTCNAYAVSSLC
jgi:hypothetical protein